MTAPIKTQEEICIVGAGPAGSTTALFLNKLGVPCILLDRAVFPRDKICGESYDGHVTHTLKRLDPALLERLRGRVLECRKYALVNSSSERVEVVFPATATPRLLGRRLDFDDFLIEEVKKAPLIKFREGTAIKALERQPHGWELTTELGEMISCKLLIWAAGANSPLLAKLHKTPHGPKDEFLFSRGYFRNVAKQGPDHTVEIFFVKEPIPLCVCLCPVADDLMNVEIGLNRATAARHQVNIRKLLPEIINGHPELRERFRHAKLEGKIKGANMVLPVAKAIYSGDGFLLVGDGAASINPVTGFGVGHAMAQGQLAAEVASQCLKDGDFSAQFLKQYDQAVYKALGREILLSKVFTAAMGFIPLLDKLLAVDGLKKLMRRLLSDSNFAEKIMRPFSWWQPKAPSKLLPSPHKPN